MSSSTCNPDPLSELRKTATLYNQLIYRLRNNGMEQEDTSYFSRTTIVEYNLGKALNTLNKLDNMSSDDKKKCRALLVLFS